MVVAMSDFPSQKGPNDMTTRKDRIHPGMRDEEKSDHTILSERDSLLVFSLSSRTHRRLIPN